jgi:hypothetical protein
MNVKMQFVKISSISRMDEMVIHEKNFGEMEINFANSLKRYIQVNGILFGEFLLACFYEKSMKSLLLRIFLKSLESFLSHEIEILIKSATEYLSI